MRQRAREPVDYVSPLRTGSHVFLLLGFLAGIFAVPLAIAIEAVALFARRAFEPLLHLIVCRQRYCRSQHAKALASAQECFLRAGKNVRMLLLE